MTVTPQGKAAARAYHTSGGPTAQRWDAAAQAAIDWWHAERELEPPREIAATAEAYKQHVKGLLQPVRDEMNRLRDAGSQP